MTFDVLEFRDKQERFRLKVWKWILLGLAVVMLLGCGDTSGAGENITNSQQTGGTQPPEGDASASVPVQTDTEETHKNSGADNVSQGGNGEEEGGSGKDADIPGFEKYNLRCDAQVDKKYDYVTCTQADTSMKTIGEVSFVNYKTFASDKEHTAKEGYEWKTVQVNLRFSDANAQSYGWKLGVCNEDYYTIEQHDRTMTLLESKGNLSKMQYTVTFQGEQYTECECIQQYKDFGWENDVSSACMIYYFCVPAGYDGCVVGVRNAVKVREAGDYIYDVADSDSVFFRLKAVE